MDDNKTKIDAKKSVKSEPMFSLERLAKDCYKIFGVSPSTFAGATVGLEADCKMTVADMKAHIKKWLDTPIKLGGRAVK